MDFATITFPAKIQNITTHKVDGTVVYYVVCTTESGTLIKFMVEQDKALRAFCRARTSAVKITVRLEDFKLLHVELDQDRIFCNT
mmetsp:Transcript_27575/g.38892  ORF Transcript_27575/g.38892 Transcript_27575/m.38892 type:complete len:85 (-) Transcript_27575:38-292(-)